MTYLKYSLKSMLLLFVTFIFIGCGAKGPKFNEFETADKDESLLYVYRVSALKGGGVSYDINVNDGETNRIIGNLKNGGYLTAKLEPNKKYEIWAKTESKSQTTLETKPGQVHCVRGEMRWGILLARPSLKAVDIATCMAEIVKTNRSSP